MKLFILLAAFISHSAFACDLTGLKKEVSSHFTKNAPVQNVLGEQQGTTTLKELKITDQLMRIHGENFFLTKLVFNILWANGKKKDKEILMAAVVDLGSCKLESFESGDIVGSTLTTY